MQNANPAYVRHRGVNAAATFTPLSRGMHGLHFEFCILNFALQ